MHTPCITWVLYQIAKHPVFGMHQCVTMTTPWTCVNNKYLSNYSHCSVSSSFHLSPGVDTRWSELLGEISKDAQTDATNCPLLPTPRHLLLSPSSLGTGVLLGLRAPVGQDRRMQPSSVQPRERGGGRLGACVLSRFGFSVHIRRGTLLKPLLGAGDE